MYLDFYGLKQPPFNITCNPDLFFESSSHREARAAFQYGIKEKKGIILITGEVGTGKTTLCKLLLNKISPEIKTSLILNPYFSHNQLLQAMVEDFGMQVIRKNRLDIINQLNEFLLDINSQGGNAVLIIDEAQNLTPRQLEQVRLLSNLETSREKLLQIVLVGQPELAQKLKQPGLRQIRQRIFVKHNLLPLPEDEVKDYIRLRLQMAGDASIEILPECYKVIYNFSQGTPRLINMLCDRALLLGFVKEKKIFCPEVFNMCVKELE